MVYSVGGNEYVKSGHLSIFTSLKHFMMLLECNGWQRTCFIKNFITENSKIVKS